VTFALENFSVSVGEETIDDVSPKLDQGADWDRIPA